MFPKIKIKKMERKSETSYNERKRVNALSGREGTDLKIIHCADLHLDAPMETHMTRDQAIKRKHEILMSFRNMCKYASEQGVRLVLIAGDLFDRTCVSGRTVEEVLGAMRGTPEVDYFYISGNHDDRAHAFAGRDMPGNLHLFSDQWNAYSYEDVMISGIEITEKNKETLYETLVPQTGRVNIVMLHGQIGTACGADMVNRNLLSGRNISYLALGHLHTYAWDKLDEKGIYCYPGCLEGHGFDECGEKGFVLLDTDAPRLKPEFVPFAMRQLHRVEVDITGAESNAKAAERIRTATGQIAKKDMVEVILSGETDPFAFLSKAYLQNEIAGDFFFVKVKDETRVKIDPKEYENDISLKGEFIRLVLAGTESDEEKAAMIRTGLEALMGEEITL